MFFLFLWRFVFLTKKKKKKRQNTQQQQQQKNLCRKKNTTLKQKQMNDDDDDDDEEEEEEEEKIPRRVLEELGAFFLLHKEDDDDGVVAAASLTVSLDDETNEKKNETKKNFSAPTTAVRARIHEFVRKEGKNKFGSRTIETTNQIRVFRKKDYFSDNKREEEEEGEEETEAGELPSSSHTEHELGNVELRRFDFRKRLELRKDAKINADVARSKYHKLSQRLHPSYLGGGGGGAGKKQCGWCDQCGMLLELGRWYRFTTTAAASAAAAAMGEREDQRETSSYLTDICRVCLEIEKNKRRNRNNNNAYVEMEKSGELVLIKDLSAFGEKGSELREMYCCSSSSSDEDGDNDDGDDDAVIITRAHKATLDFKKLTVAYLCFRDPSRTEIYENFGFDQLKRHEENYSDVNIFECDPWEVYENFFEGKDEDDRQYLLFNGMDVESSDSEDEMMEKEEEEEEDDTDEDMDEDSEEDLKLLEQAKEMAKEQKHEQQKKVIMSKSTSANEVLKFPFYKSSGVHDRFVDDDEDEEEEKKNDIWSTTISKAAV